MKPLASTIATITEVGSSQLRTAWAASLAKAIIDIFPSSIAPFITYSPDSEVTHVMQFSVYFSMEDMPSCLNPDSLIPNLPNLGTDAQLALLEAAKRSHVKLVSAYTVLTRQPGWSLVQTAVTFNAEDTPALQSLKLTQPARDWLASQPTQRQVVALN